MVNNFLMIFLADVWLLAMLYFLGYWAVEKESKDTWGGAKTMEMKESQKRSKDWTKKHLILDFFQNCYYELGRKWEIPGDTYDNIKYFIQRGKRGYSDRDVWGLQHYLDEVLIDSLKSLKGQLHGYPCGQLNVQSIQTDDKEEPGMTEWKRIIGEIIWTFEVINKVNNHEWYLITDERSRKRMEKFVKSMNAPDPETLFPEIPQSTYYLMTKEECKRYKQGWKYFQQYYFDLWD
jgi:hypothetical protein